MGPETMTPTHAGPQASQLLVAAALARGPPPSPPRRNGMPVASAYWPRATALMGQRGLMGGWIGAWDGADRADIHKRCSGTYRPWPDELLDRAVDPDLFSLFLLALCAKKDFPL